MRPKPARDTSASEVTGVLERFLSKVPESDEPEADDPRSRSARIAKAAARRASAISAALSLPPGPFGLATLVPDLLAIWDVQRKMVADIAAAYGQSATLTRESMIWCLFKHGGAALARDVAVRTAERFVVQPAGVAVLTRTASRLGVHVSRQALGRAVSRFVPLLGALCVGAYAYRDTSQVAANAIELFSRDAAAR
jgi:uncharacterized protein (DUF697 family)